VILVLAIKLASAVNEELQSQQEIGEALRIIT
jgi:hypothetical protein